MMLPKPSMFGLSLDVRVRHAAIRDAIKKLGSAKKLAEHLGLQYQTVLGWHSMTNMPRIHNCHPGNRAWYTNGELRSEIGKKLFALTGKTLDELFPTELAGEREAIRGEQNFEIKSNLLSRIGKSQSRIRSPEDAAIENEMKAAVMRAMKSLSYREREIVKLRYGLGGDGYGYTLEEVGRIFKVHKERIRQIEAKAIRKLQQSSNAQELIGFVE